MEMVTGTIDLDRRWHDITMRCRGKKSDNEFMCEMPKGVSHVVRRSAAKTCGRRGFGTRALCEER